MTSNLDRHIEATRRRGEGKRSQPSRKEPRKSHDPTSCPPGLREDVWGLTKLFIGLAAKDGIELDERSPFLIYDHLLYRCEKSGVMHAPVELLLDSLGEQRTWCELVAFAIREFFEEDLRDAYALETFCREATFRRLCQTVRRRAYYHRLQRKAAEQRAARG